MSHAEREAGTALEMRTPRAGKGSLDLIGISLARGPDAPSAARITSRVVDALPTETSDVCQQQAHRKRREVRANFSGTAWESTLLTHAVAGWVHLPISNPPLTLRQSPVQMDGSGTSR